MVRPEELEVHSRQEMVRQVEEVDHPLEVEEDQVVLEELLLEVQEDLGVLVDQVVLEEPPMEDLVVLEELPKEVQEDHEDQEVLVGLVILEVLEELP